MASTFRVINKTDQPIDISFDEAMRSITEKIIASNPLAVTIVWETEKAVEAVSIPSANAVVRGLIDTLYERIHGMDVQG